MRERDPLLWQHQEQCLSECSGVIAYLDGNDVPCSTTKSNGSVLNIISVQSSDPSNTRIALYTLVAGGAHLINVQVITHDDTIQLRRKGRRSNIRRLGHFISDWLREGKANQSARSSEALNLIRLKATQ